MNFKNLTDLELETEIIRAVKEEHKSTMKVIHLLAEVERRRLYSKKHPSLHRYCVEVLKYNGGTAQRRIDTMRAMKLVPEIESKIVNGDLNMTNISQVQSFFRHEHQAGKDYSNEQKKELLMKTENQTTRECIEALVAISPKFVPQEKRRILTPEKIELKTVIDIELSQKLDQLKALLSHKNPNMTDAELLNQMADIALEKLTPKKPKTKASSAESLPALEVKSTNPRYIPQKMKAYIWHRDQGRCTHGGCGSNYFIQYDHIVPIALGGKTIESNLRLLCQTHNQASARQLGLLG